MAVNGRDLMRGASRPGEDAAGRLRRKANAIDGNIAPGSAADHRRRSQRRLPWPLTDSWTLPTFLLTLAPSFALVRI